MVSCPAFSCLHFLDLDPSTLDLLPLPLALSVGDDASAEKNDEEQKNNFTTGEIYPDMMVVLDRISYGIYLKSLS